MPKCALHTKNAMAWMQRQWLIAESMID